MDSTWGDLQKPLENLMFLSGRLWIFTGIHWPRETNFWPEPKILPLAETFENLAKMTIFTIRFRSDDFVFNVEHWRARWIPHGGRAKSIGFPCVFNRSQRTAMSTQFCTVGAGGFRNQSKIQVFIRKIDRSLHDMPTQARTWSHCCRSEVTMVVVFLCSNWIEIPAV